MSLPIGWGIFLFFLVPPVLWGLVLLIIKKAKGEVRLLSLIAGSDNRLSLSKLQALAWTLVIFGAFATAIAIHKEIRADHAVADKSAAEAARTKAAEDKKKQETALDEAKKHAEESAKAKVEADRAVAAAESAVNNASTADLKTNAQKVLDAAKDKAKTAAETKERDDKQLIAATDEVNKAEAKLAELKSSDWVQIPAELLALAGIAIGSGVFSSLISAMNSEEKIARITSVQSIARNTQLGIPASLAEARAKAAQADNDLTAKKTQRDNDAQALATAQIAPNNAPVNPALQAQLQAAQVAAQKSEQDVKDASAALVIANLVVTDLERKAQLNADRYCLIINGEALKSEGGTVRFGKLSGSVSAHIREWKDDTKIIVDVPDHAPLVLVVDTANGKVCYQLNGSPANFSLGDETTCYEWGDLFRDDKNPSKFSLMKFQMFGWTVVAIVIYVYLFLHDLHNQMETLPIVPPSIVALTGVSQAGYLWGKAASNVNKPGANQAQA